MKTSNLIYLNRLCTQVIGVARRTFDRIILMVTSFILTQWTKFKMIIRAYLLELLHEEVAEGT